MSHAVERRASARRDAVRNLVSLRFPGIIGYRKAEATLVKISSSGALIVTRERPALDQPLWITIVRPVSSNWIEAIPVRFDADDQIGLKFGRGGCGSYFLWVATHGIDMNQLLGSE